MYYRPYGRHVEYSEYFRAFEQIVIQVGGRPHWAKVCNFMMFILIFYITKIIFIKMSLIILL